MFAVAVAVAAVAAVAAGGGVGGVGGGLRLSPGDLTFNFQTFFI